jgi:O-antigen ligase
MLADPGIGSWHNDYVQVYMDSGLTALVCLAIVIAAVYRQAWKAFRSGCLTPGERNILAGSLVSLTLVFLMGGFLDILAGLLVRILLAVVALLAVRSTQLREAKEETQGGMPLSHVVPL